MSDNMFPNAAEDLTLPASVLDGFEPVEPDPQVWHNILDEINAGSGRADTAGTPSPVRRWTPYLLSVAAVFLLVLGFAAVMVSGSPDVVASRQLVDPATADVVMSVDTYDSGATIVTASELPVLDDGETYQLWAVTGGEIVSVGLLGQDASGAEFRVEGEPSILALTVEVAGGVAVSEQDPVAVWGV